MRDVVDFAHAIRAGLSEAGVRFQVVEAAPYTFAGFISDAWASRTSAEGTAELVAYSVAMILDHVENGPDFRVGPSTLLPGRPS